MSERRESGFTLLELLVVVAIIGIVTAVAVPQLLNAVDRGKQTGTMADLRTIVTAVQRYSIDHDRYPSAGNLQELAGLLEPTYIPRLPRQDSWGNPLVYEVGAGGLTYTLRSPGKDGTLQASPPAGRTHSFEDDIVCVDGAFLQWPAGSQE